MNKGTYKIIDFIAREDDRGALVALEGLSKQVPFSIQRVYYIFNNSSNMIRGRHAHYNLQQLLIVVAGTCSIDLDDGINKTTIHLNTPKKGLLLDGFIWREMKNFSSNCVLMVLASEHYNEKDYVRNYEQFLKEALR